LQVFSGKVGKLTAIISLFALFTAFAHAVRTIEAFRTRSLAMVFTPTFTYTFYHVGI